MVASTVTEPTLNMSTTPAQLTEMIASALATALTNQQPVNRDFFNTTTSGSISNASIGPEIENLGGHIIRSIIHEVPLNLYRQTSSITNEGLKRSRLSDTNTDNTKRKAAILIILKSEDLLTLITKVRSKPIKTSSKPIKMAIHQENVLQIVKVKKKRSTVMMNIYIAMISIGYILQ